MYTSGSTGTPRGVLNSQRNLVHQCRARLHRFDDAPGILLGTFSFAFDSSLAGISHTLCAGAPCVLPASGCVAIPQACAG